MPMIVVECGNVPMGQSFDAVLCDGNRRCLEFLRKHLGSTV